MTTHVAILCGYESEYCIWLCKRMHVHWEVAAFFRNIHNTSKPI